MRSSPFSFASCAALAGLTAAVSATNAAVIYVDADAIGVPTGVSWFTAFRTLTPALAAAGDGDEIWIASGRYVPPPAGWTLTSGASLYGGFTPGATSVDDRDPIGTPTVLDADVNGDDGAGFTNRSDNAEWVLRIDAPGTTLAVSGFVIRGSEGSSALDVKAAEIDIDNCLFQENRRRIPEVFGPASTSEGVFGGGLLARDEVGTVRVTDCVFEQNLTKNTGTLPGSTDPVSGGGGAFASFATSTTISGCRFEQNSSEHSSLAAGGAVYSISFDVSIDGSEFVGNTGTGPAVSGGALLVSRDAFLQAFDVAVTGCRFENNHANSEDEAFGGAAHLVAARLDLSRCSFISNSASETGDESPYPLGGALFVNAVSSMNMVSCRVLGNTAEGGRAGGVDILPISEFPEDVLIDNCLVAGNRSGQVGGVFVPRPATVTNSTIAFNSATAPGGPAPDVAGLAINASLLGMGVDEARVRNTILWGNDTLGVVDEAAQFDFGDALPVVSHSLIQGWTGSLGGTANAGDDPLFTDPDGNDGILGTDDDGYFLNRFSPAIDAGSNTLVPADGLDLDGDGDTSEALPLDAAGRARLVDDIDVADAGTGNAPIVDIGAYEFQRRSCPSDLNSDGLLDLADIVLFVTGFLGESPDTDLNGDGLWDLADIVFFVSVFNAGCP